MTEPASKRAELNQKAVDEIRALALIERIGRRERLLDKWDEKLTQLRQQVAALTRRAEILEYEKQRIIEIGEAEIAALNEAKDAQHAKFDGCPHTLAVAGREWNGLCGCSYDKPSDVCAVHAPQLRKALAETAALTVERDATQQWCKEYRNAGLKAEAENATLKARAEQAEARCKRLESENSRLLNDASVWRNRAIDAEEEMAGTNRIAARAKEQSHE